MKLTLHVIKNNPSNIEEIEMDDVCTWSMDENNLYVKFNKGDDEVIPLRANDGEGQGDWIGISIFGTRQFLKIDMSK